MVGIYKITSPTGKVYIGQSRDIQYRFSRYKSLRCKKQIKLHRSFVKHGVENHLMEVLELCDFDEMNERERHYQDLFNVCSKSGLNCVLVSTKDKPYVISDEARLSLRVRNLGKKHSKETIKKISNSKKGQGLGRKITDTQKINISKSRIGIVFSDEHRKNLSISHKGQTPSNIDQLQSKECRALAAKNRIGKGTGWRNSQSKIVLNFETGIFYESRNEAADSINHNKDTLSRKLCGKRLNNTNFAYV